MKPCLHILFLLLSFMLLLSPAHAQQPVLSGDSSTIPDDEARRKAAQLALKHLSRQLNSRGLKHPGSNGGFQVTYAMAGMAFLADGADLNEGSHQKELRKIMLYLMRHTGKLARGRLGKGQDLSTWVYASSLIFMAELHHRNPNTKIKSSMQDWADELVKRQTASGGWLHSGNKKSNTAPYQELNAINIWCLTALSMAKASGATVPQKTLDQAIQYLHQSTRKDGEVAYSLQRLQIKSRFRRVVPGRTAGAWVALKMSNTKENPRYEKMQQFSMKYMKALPYGHGSPVMHLHWGASLAWLSGDEAWSQYWQLFGASLLKRQQKNGMIQMPVRHAFEGDDRASAMQAWILLLPEQQLQLFGQRKKK